MNHTDLWEQFLSECPEIQGGAIITTDGVVVSYAGFGSLIDRHISVVRCAAAIAIAQQLGEGSGRGEFEECILDGHSGYIILMPFLERAILVVLADKQAKLGLVVLEMRRAINGLFGPGLAAETIIPPQSPKHDRTNVRPESE